jgi:putative aminopeptidase FrvX
MKHNKIWLRRRGATLIIATPQGRTVQSNAHWDEIGRIIAAVEVSGLA